MTPHDAFLDAWAAAEREGDAAASDRLLTDDFVGIGPVGFMLDKAAWLGRYADLHYDGLSLDETATRHYGDTGWRLAGIQFSFIAGTPGAPGPPAS